MSRLTTHASRSIRSPRSTNSCPPELASATVGAAVSRSVPNREPRIAAVVGAADQALRGGAYQRLLGWHHGHLPASPRRRKRLAKVAAAIKRPKQVPGGRGPEEPFSAPRDRDEAAAARPRGGDADHRKALRGSRSVTAETLPGADQHARALAGAGWEERQRSRREATEPEGLKGVLGRRAPRDGGGSIPRATHGPCRAVPTRKEALIDGNAGLHLRGVTARLHPVHPPA